jgi:EthD domain-containing protein
VNGRRPVVLFASVAIDRLTQWHPREGLSRDDALRYWTEQHAKLLVDVPGLRGYVQPICSASPMRMPSGPRM